MASLKSVSPLEHVENMFQGHDQALKQAFYNTAATVFAVIVCCATIAVYHILEVFIRPLLWAVLCGTFLHPFKHALTHNVTLWLQGLRKSGTPLLFGTAILPLQALDKGSEALSSAFFRKFKLICGFALSLPCAYFVYNFAPLRHICYGLKLTLYAVYDGLGYFHAFWVWTIVVAYIVCVIFFWSDQTSVHLRRLSVPVWILVLLYFVSFAGALRVPVLLAMFGIMILGFASEVSEARKKHKHTDISSPTRSAAKRVLENENLRVTPPGSANTSVDNDNETVDKEQEEKVNEEVADDSEAKSAKSRPSDLSVESLTQSSSRESATSESEAGGTKKKDKKPRKLSDQCFIVLLWAIALTQVWLHLWVIQLLPIVVIFLTIKKLGYIVASADLVRDKCEAVFKTVKDDQRIDVIVPKPIRGLGTLILRGDVKIVCALESSMDKFISALIVLLGLIGAVLLSFFMVVQIHRESMHLVSVTSNVVNNTLQPQFHQWMPDNDTMRDTIDSMLGNAYIYGREYIAKKVHSLVNGQENEMLEQQLLGVYDQVYQRFIVRNGTNGTDAAEGALMSQRSLVRSLSLDQIDIHNVSSLWNLAKRTEDFNLDIWGFVQENIGVFMQVSESVWLVLRSNITLLGNLLVAIISLVFGGGTAILNFILSMIIFITTLFYLLAASGDMYLPLKWISSLTPSMLQTAAEGNQFGTAVEKAIGSVFLASLKMAGFYGLYTYFTHTLFGIRMVYIPAALASMFAAIPFVGTYWACIPAVIELWLVNGDVILAALLFGFHLLPTYVVDTAIYSDIKGGHPYLTGLAIAGGMYWMGLEGAIMGPIVLVCLIVAVNMYSTMLKPEPITPLGKPTPPK